MSIRFIFSVVILLTINLSITAQSFEMLISSRNTNSVKRYNGETGEFIDDFVKSGAGGLSTTQEVLIDTDGNLLVSGRGNKYILKFDGATGEFLGNFTSGYELDNPTKMTLGPDGNLYISQWGTTQRKIARFNFITGEFVDEFTSINLNQSCGHAWDAEGNLYVASFGSKDVKKFDTSGQYLGVFAEAGHLQGAVNLWFDSLFQYLFVLDWTKGAVEKFDAVTGQFVEDFISGLNNAEGFAWGPDGKLYICEWSGNKIKRYDTDGSYIGVFASGGGMVAPNSVLFRPTQITNVGDKGFGFDFQLNQNYPNPFNPTTKIKFSVPLLGGDARTQLVSLTIYDVLGRNVATLVNETKTPGTYEVQFDAAGFPSGTYFYRLQAGEFNQTNKMILLK